MDSFTRSEPSARHAGGKACPGMRNCPYLLRHAQEEMLVVIKGSGTLRVAREMLSIKVGDVMFIPAVLSTRTRS